MAKIDDIRCFAEDIAQWRVEGLTWAQIAAKLVEEDIHVGTDEIRSYWPRLSDGRSPAEYLLYWQNSRRNAELRESKRRAEAAEVEIEALRQQVQAWEQQMQSLLTQEQQSETLRTECDRLREEARQQERAATKDIEHLRHQIGELTERADAWQREANEANGRAQAASADAHQLRQQVSKLERQLAEAEARTAKVVAENEVYGNIRYYMGMGQGQAQLDEVNKTLNGWIRFGEALCQAHQAGNRREMAQLLDRVVAWAASRGKA
ncbi:MAG TPA: hypothetical protein VK196_03355 [Magnetospirillum sp.]|nr:hypothetical protein [Magnetospirillum sp.]